MKLRVNKYIPEIHYVSKHQPVENTKLEIRKYLSPNPHENKREIFESTGDDSLTLSFPKSKNTEFTAFTIERDHVGKILSPKYNDILPPLKTKKLTIRLIREKDSTNSNKVLIKRNNFLFFEKGKKMVAKSTNSYFDFLKVHDGITAAEPEEDGAKRTEEFKKNRIEKEEKRTEITETKNEEIRENFEEEEKDEKMGELEEKKRIFKRQATLANYLKENILNDSILGKKRMKLVENNRDYNKMNFGVKKNFKKIGKIIDSANQEKLLSSVSHLGLYDINYDQIEKKSPHCVFSQNFKKERLPEVNPNFTSLAKRAKKVKTKDDSDRILFAKILREIDEQIKSHPISDDINLGIPEHLSYKYEHSKDYVIKFHKKMKTGFDMLRKGFNALKILMNHGGQIN